MPESDRQKVPHTLSPPPRLSDAELLLLWETAQREEGHRRALVILQTAYPELEAPAKLPMGEINHRLIALREAQFGAAYAFVDKCPACAEGVEFSVTAAEMLSGPKAPADASFELVSGQWTVRYRLLQLADWEQSTAGGEAETAEAIARKLLTPALLDICHRGEASSPEALPEAVWEALAEAIAAADPLGEIEFGLTCPKCATGWQSVFEPADYFLRELGREARKILVDVHQIASAYGWSEPEILALSPSRRAAYLQLIEEAPADLSLDSATLHREAP